MLKPDFTEEEIEQLYRLFMEHPSGAVKKRLHVVYLKALGLPHQDIVHIAMVSGDSVTRYLKAYVEGSVPVLCTTQYYCPPQCTTAAPGRTQNTFSSPFAAYRCRSLAHN